MARVSRRQLANSRALEEEGLRQEMRGSGHYIGRGGVPSMGLSQFRGGKCYMCDEDVCCCSSDSEEEKPKRKKRGGLKYSTALVPATSSVSRFRFPTSIVPSRTGIPPSLGNLGTMRPGLLPLVPYRPSTSLLRPGGLLPSGGPSTAIIPLGPSGRPIARPSLPASYYQNLLRPSVRPSPSRPAIGDIPVAPPVRLPTGSRPSYGSLAARAALLGVPLAVLIASLAADKGPDMPAYADDVDDDGDGDGDRDGGDDVGDDGDDVVVCNPGCDDPNCPGCGGGGGGGGLPPDVVDNLTRDELAWYLRSGNLPDRFYVGSYSQKKQKVGRGKARKPSARNEIVKRVMAERGCSLPEASSIVKREGLY